MTNEQTPSPINKTIHWFAVKTASSLTSNKQLNELKNNLKKDVFAHLSAANVEYSSNLNDNMTNKQIVTAQINNSIRTMTLATAEVLLPDQNDRHTAKVKYQTASKIIALCTPSTKNVKCNNINDVAGETVERIERQTTSDSAKSMVTISHIRRNFRPSDP